MSKHDAQRINVEGDTRFLQDGCLYCVGQCARLLELVPAELYARCSPDNSSVGTHMRHVLDRFQCFFQGLGTGCIDYDDRSRDPELESNIAAAEFAVHSLHKRFGNLEPGVIKCSIEVREAVHHELGAVAIPSTVAREMLSLISHSVHHLAIIAMLLKARGIDIDPDFGKAPSTLIFEQG